MQPIQPDQAIFLLNGAYLPSLKNEQRITRSIIEAIPLDKGDYRPDEISKSALELAWHIAVTEMRFLDAVAAGEFDFSPRPLPDSVKNSGDLAGWYTDNFAPRFEALTKLSSEQLLKIIDFRGMFQLPAVTYLNFLLHHSSTIAGSCRCIFGRWARKCHRSTAKATTPQRLARRRSRVFEA